MNFRKKGLLPIIVAGAISIYVANKKFDDHQHEKNVARAEEVAKKDTHRAEPATYAPVVCELSFDKNAIWYNRDRALEARSRCDNTPKEHELNQILTIAESDDDWRIRKRAQEMIQSYTRNQDFTATEGYRQLVARNERLTLGKRPSVGYHAEDLWYDRLENLEHRACAGTIVLPNATTDLADIARKDDDYRIQQLAKSMLASARNSGDYAGARKDAYCKQ